MKKSALIVLISTLFTLSSNAYMYDCENKDFKIVVDGSVVADIDLDSENFITEIFKNDISVTVTEKATKTTNTYTTVAAITDGAGQDSFQSFVVDGYLTPLEMMTDFYYEHEGGCLDGSVYSTTQKKWISFDGCWGDSENRMMCDGNF